MRPQPLTGPRIMSRQTLHCSSLVVALTEGGPSGPQWMHHYITLLAGAREIAGQVEEALALLEEALRTADRTGERWLTAELYRHKGQLLLRQGHSEAAEKLYRQALSIA